MGRAGIEIWYLLWRGLSQASFVEQQQNAFELPYKKIGSAEMRQIDSKYLHSVPSWACSIPSPFQQCRRPSGHPHKATLSTLSLPESSSFLGCSLATLILLPSKPCQFKSFVKPSNKILQVLRVAISNARWFFHAAGYKYTVYERNSLFLQDLDPRARPSRCQ